MKNALFMALAASMLTATALPAHAFVLPVLRVKVMVPVAQPVQQDWRTGDNRFEQWNDRDHGDRRDDYKNDRFRKHPVPIPPPTIKQASREHHHPVVFHR